MYAIVETGGKQYKVAPGEIIKVEKIEGERGQAVELDKVLVVAGDERVNIGSPYVENAKVKAVIEEQGKDDKIIVFKYKNKRKQSRRKHGHRQLFTALRIESIE